MPLKLNEREYRAVATMAPVSSAEKRLDSEFYVQGYATTFNDPYVLWDEYREQIDRHALDGADLSDVICQFNHEGRVLARGSNGTLLLEMDDHGLFVAADLSKSDAARSLYEDIANGLVTKMSWAFTVKEDSYDTDAKLRSILKVKKVYDVSAVSLPANDATAISARSWVEGVIDAEMRESQARRARVLRIRTQL